MLASDCVDWIGSDGGCGGGAPEQVVFRFNISPRPFAFGLGAAGPAPCGPPLFCLKTILSRPESLIHGHQNIEMA